MRIPSTVAHAAAPRIHVPRRIAVPSSTPTPTASSSAAPAPDVGRSITGVPRESLDALENLPKEAPRQVAFGELQGEVPGMSDEPRAGLEKPLLEARQGPALDGDGQDQPAQQIAEVIGDHPEEQPHLVGPEAVAGEPGPVGGFLAFLDPLLCRPALVVEADDGPVRPRQGGDDEAHP